MIRIDTVWLAEFNLKAIATVADISLHVATYSKVEGPDETEVDKVHRFEGTVMAMDIHGLENSEETVYMIYTYILYLLYFCYIYIYMYLIVYIYIYIFVILYLYVYSIFIYYIILYYIILYIIYYI